MKLIFPLALLLSVPLAAQTLSFAIHTASGDQPLPAAYSFPDTAEGASSSITVDVTNSGKVPVSLTDIYVSTDAAFSAQTPNFSVTGLALDSVLAPGGFKEFTINFTPTTTGALTAYLQAVYDTQQNGCSLTASSPQCVASLASFSTLQGNGTPPAIVLSYASGGSNVVLQPSSPSPLNFGNVSLSATSAITFTISNQSSSAVTTPAVTLQVQLYNSSAFKLDASNLPATLAANSSATFTVTFAPGQTGLSTATLDAGSSAYPIEGTGVALADIDALQVSYVDQTGVRTQPQAATPISFGQVVSGTSGTATLTFTVANPQISFNAITLPSLTVSGAAFSITGAPTLPTSIQPGASITFQLVFSPTATGSFSGSLSIGTRAFSLAGQSVTLPLPALSFQLSAMPLLSQQQVNLTVQLAAASPISAIGDLTMQFTPSVAGVSDDPAIMFLATNTRELQVAVASGAQSATYNGQSDIAFQTGTTAGTIAFTLTFPDVAPYTQSFTIAPSQIFITSAQAVTESPNLVVTLDGYDNTYSAGQLSFLFYDTSGKQVTPSALQVDATADFHQYFFTNNQAGGAFALQATFPVTGDATKVGSVTVTLTNSAGQESKTLSFQ